MTRVALKIPERLEKQARKAGLLSGPFLRGAIEEELARRGAARRLAKNVRQFRATGLAPVTADEIQAEIDAVRAMKRGTRADRR